MTRLFSIILDVLLLLKSQRRDTQNPIGHQHNTGDFKAELQLIQAALKQIDAGAKADRALKNEELRLERSGCGSNNLRLPSSLLARLEPSLICGF